MSQGKGTGILTFAFLSAIFGGLLWGLSAALSLLKLIYELINKQTKNK
tara:strand:- start:523 stop:666 length:144 start_codon:yes stop_codon:yes gene_type:complete